MATVPGNSDVVHWWRRLKSHSATSDAIIMNSIIRIILRGLVSGEIKPDPEVFQYLKELSERAPRRHGRMLCLRLPASQSRSQTEVEFLQRSSLLGGEHEGACRPEEPAPPNETRQYRSGTSGLGASSTRWLRLALSIIVVAVCSSQALQAAEAAAATAHLSAPNANQNGLPGSAFDAFHSWRVAGKSFGIAFTTPPFPESLIVVSGVLLLGFGVRAGWIWLCDHWLFVMQPYERALQELEAAKFRFQNGIIEDPSPAVVHVLTEYLKIQFGMQIDGSGPEAIQRALHNSRPSMKVSQRSMLERSLKSAQNEVTTGQQRLANLGDQAIRFVWATACCRPSGSPSAAPATAPT